MQRQISALILFIAVSAHAETFDDRVRIAKAAENSDAYKSYEPVMFGRVTNRLASIMVTCFDTTKQPVADPFVFVADIAPTGKLQSIEVRPSTNIANCFASALKELEFPAPPEYANRVGFPIVFEMRMRP